MMPAAIFIISQQHAIIDPGPYSPFTIDKLINSSACVTCLIQCNEACKPTPEPPSLLSLTASE